MGRAGAGLGGREAGTGGQTGSSHRPLWLGLGTAILSAALARGRLAPALLPWLLQGVLGGRGSQPRQDPVRVGERQRDPTAREQIPPRGLV